jgi:BRCA1-associated protein
LPEGTVHVYRESNSKQRLPIDESTASDSIPTDIEEGADDMGDVILGVLAVPAWMTPSDFLTFVAPAAEGMAHLRMIRYKLCRYVLEP